MNDNNDNQFLDLTFYRDSYSDLKHLDDESLTRHYKIHGENVRTYHVHFCNGRLLQNNYR